MSQHSTTWPKSRSPKEFNNPFTKISFSASHDPLPRGLGRHFLGEVILSQSQIARQHAPVMRKSHEDQAELSWKKAKWQRNIMANRKWPLFIFCDNQASGFRLETRPRPKAKDGISHMTPNCNSYIQMEPEWLAKKIILISKLLLRIHHVSWGSPFRGPPKFMRGFPTWTLGVPPNPEKPWK